MMLGEYYSAKLDPPVLFEIVRNGVPYARVYHLRRRTIRRCSPYRHRKDQY